MHFICEKTLHSNAFAITHTFILLLYILALSQAINRVSLCIHIAYSYGRNYTQIDSNKIQWKYLLVE